MPISKRITTDDNNVKSIINKGGSAPKLNDIKTTKLLQLRIENNLINEIDNILKSDHYPKMSRHSWIMFAIKEFLKKEKEKI